MIELVFIERVEPYVKGSDTGEVALKLEREYEVCKRFSEFISKDLEDKFFFYLGREKDWAKGFSNALFLTSNWLTNEWRTYIEMAKHGLTTKASQKRGDPAFVDTRAYYRNMQVMLRGEL